MPRSPALSAPRSYADLRRGVEAVVLRGRRDIDRAWLLTYHETGRLINGHVLLNRDRADYGARVYDLLSADLGISVRTLRECAQFQRCFPNWRTCAELGWAQCRLLCQVEDEKQRQLLLRDAIKHRWTVVQLAERVRPLNAIDVTGSTAANRTTPKLLSPRRGTVGVCKVVDAGSGPVVDLGFATYLDLPADSGLKPGDFARLDAAGRATLAGGATKTDLFTYAAAVLKVVDGDTLWVKVHLDPRRWLKQKLRLRDLDCPEIATAEGTAAKRFTEGLVARATAVTICTTKPDKYDRYLADVFLTLPGSEGFLNNALLEAGHATIKREWEFTDWGR